MCIIEMHVKDRFPLYKKRDQETFRKFQTIIVKNLNFLLKNALMETLNKFFNSVFSLVTKMKKM